MREFQQRVAARLAQIQSRAEAAIFRLPGVVGMGIGATEDGRGLEFIVFVRTQTRVPDRVLGVPVRFVESGEFRAY